MRLEGQPLLSDLAILAAQAERLAQEIEYQLSSQVAVGDPTVREAEQVVLRSVDQAQREGAVIAAGVVNGSPWAVHGDCDDIVGDEGDVDSPDPQAGLPPSGWLRMCSSSAWRLPNSAANDRSPRASAAISCGVKSGVRVVTHSPSDVALIVASTLARTTGN